MNLAQGNVDFGTITQPGVISPAYGSVENGAIGVLLNTVFNLLLVVAGIYALFNFILAGYAFLAAGDDPKQIQGAWAKIHQSVIGLLIAAGSLVLAAIFGQILFGDPGFLINPSIPTP